MIRHDYTALRQKAGWWFSFYGANVSSFTWQEMTSSVLWTLTLTSDLFVALSSKGLCRCCMFDILLEHVTTVLWIYSVSLSSVSWCNPKLTFKTRSMWAVTQSDWGFFVFLCCWHFLLDLYGHALTLCSHFSSLGVLHGLCSLFSHLSSLCSRCFIWHGHFCVVVIFQSLSGNFMFCFARSISLWMFFFLSFI